MKSGQKTGHPGAVDFDASVTAELPVSSSGNDRAVAFAMNMRIATGEFSRNSGALVGRAEMLKKMS